MTNNTGSHPVATVTENIRQMLAEQDHTVEWLAEQINRTPASLTEELDNLDELLLETVIFCADALGTTPGGLATVTA